MLGGYNSIYYEVIASQTSTNCKYIETTFFHEGRYLGFLVADDTIFEIFKRN
jgi:hypothetical protein